MGTPQSPGPAQQAPPPVRPGLAPRPQREGPGPWRVAVTLLVAAAVVLGGGLAARAWLARPVPVAPEVTSSPKPTTASTPRTQAAQVVALLSRSTAGKKAIIRAVAAGDACRSPGDLAAAARTAQEAMTNRQSLLRALPRLSLAGLPEGRQIRLTMQRMWTASYQADVGYRDWLRRLANGEPCGVRDSGRAAGDAQSLVATKEKRRFAQLWADVAAQLHLPTYTVAAL